MNNIWIATDWHLFCRKENYQHPYRSITNLGRLADNYAADIQPNDLFIFLGDFCDPGVSDLKVLHNIMDQIPGYKILCRGNNDTMDDAWYLSLGFDQVCDVCLIHSIVFSHKPVKIMPDMINIHGHLHTEKISTMGYQYVNAFDSNYSDHPVLLEDLLDQAVTQKPEEWADMNLAHVDEKMSEYTALDKTIQYTNIIDLTDQFTLAPVDEATSTGIFQAMALDKIETPDELLKWMKSNIHYSNFTRLKTDGELLKTKSGSCHDQVAFTYPRLKALNMEPKVLFFIAYKEGDKVGGMTHSLVYWTEADGDTVWFETSWAEAVGIRSYKSYDDMIKDITARYGRLPAATQHPELLFRKTSITKYKPGVDLKTLVNSIMQGNQQINNESISVFDQSAPEECAVYPILLIHTNVEFQSLPDVISRVRCFLDVIHSDTIEIYLCGTPLVEVEKEFTTNGLPFGGGNYSDLMQPYTIYIAYSDMVPNTMNYADIATAVCVQYFACKLGHNRVPADMINAIALHYAGPLINDMCNMDEHDKYREFITESVRDNYIFVENLIEHKGEDIIRQLLTGSVNPDDIVIEEAAKHLSPIDEILFGDLDDTKYFEADDEKDPAKKKKEPMAESAINFVDDKGNSVPKVCPKCGSKVGIFLKGEPVFLCTNKKCGKYFGTVPFNEATTTLSTYDAQQTQAVANKYGIHAVGHDDEYDKDPEDLERERQRKKAAELKAAAKEKKKREMEQLKLKKKAERKAKLNSIKDRFKPSTKNEDAADYNDPTVDSSPFGDSVRFFNHINEYPETESSMADFAKAFVKNHPGPEPFIGETYQFSLEDKNLKFSDRFVMSESSGNEQLYPVYVMLMHSGTLLANAIKKVTNSHFSHSSISFDSSMTKMYSFGRKSDANPFVGAFKYENIHEAFYQERQIPYALYVVPCTKEQIAAMKKRLDYFIKNSTKFHYDFTGLLKNYLGIADNPEYKWFCSRFVADILDAGSPQNHPYVVEPSLMKPEDFQYTNFALYVTGGFLSSYDQVFVTRVTNRILRTERIRRTKEKALYNDENEKLAIAESSVYDLNPFDPFQESVLSYQFAMLDEAGADSFIRYLQSFKVKFDKEGNIIISRREYDQLDMHFKQSLKRIKAYEKAGDITSVKDELCAIRYMIELIDKYYMDPAVKPTERSKLDIRKRMVDLRSVMLNVFQQHLKYVTVREPNMNFNAYYETSKYGATNGIPKSVISAIGRTIVTALK